MRASQASIDRPVLPMAIAIVSALASVASARPSDGPRTFATPEAAVAALGEAAKASDLDAVLAIFGPGGKDLASSSDAATARQNRDVFVVAMAEGWHLADKGTDRKELVVGNEGWPFPVPLVKTSKGWMFDAAAGKEEVLIRRIGRNELAAIHISQRYVAAQRAYARRGHDGKPAGLYARKFTADPGTENGLYWPIVKGQPLSPLGPLVAEAAAEGRQIGDGQHPPVPFHGYYFRILDAQAASAPGGARSYLVNGELTAGFGLVAWPAEYDVTGIVTFIVNQDGVVYEKDLGPDTAKVVAGIKAFNPDKTWERAQ